MDLTFTAPSDATYAAGLVLDHSLQRGDFDEDPDFESAAATVAGRLRSAAEAADDAGERDADVTVPAASLDEILAVLESDVCASSTLAPLLAAANAALAAQPAV